MTVLQDIYFVTSCLGFLYIVGSAIMGSFHGQCHAGQGGDGHAGHSHPGHSGHIHGGGAHTGAHGGSGHSARIGTHPTTGQAGAHSSNAPIRGAAPSTPIAGNHSGTHGNHHAGTHGTNNGGASHSANASSSNTNKSMGTHNSASHDLAETPNPLAVSQNSSRARRAEVPTLYLKILDILSPTKLAFFAFLFGAIGFISAKFLPDYLSIAVSVILGWLFANIFFNLLGSIFSRMNSSTNFKKESLIGSIADLSISIENGGIGEIIIGTGNSRYNFIARPANREQSIKKPTRVIVVDIKDGIFIVEPFEDDINV